MKVFGYVILVLGALGFLEYFITNYLYLLPQNMGIVLGNGAIVLLGLVTLAIAKCLDHLEGRLDKIEGALSARGDISKRNGP